MLGAVEYRSDLPPPPNPCLPNRDYCGDLGHLEVLIIYARQRLKAQGEPPRTLKLPQLPGLWTQSGSHRILPFGTQAKTAGTY